MNKNENYLKKRRVTIISIVINLFLTLLKYILGFISSSSALISDATHSLSDYVSDLIVIIALKLSSRPPDKDHPYGHGKFETFASMLVGVILILTGIFLVTEGVNIMVKFISGELSIKDTYYWAFIGAVVSLVFKEGLYFYTIHYAKKLNSLALKANAYHHRSDSYSSIAVLVGIIFTIIHPSLVFMDPVASIIVAIFIIHMGWGLLKPTFLDLVETSNDEVLLNKIKDTANNTMGVLEVDKVRVRSIGNGNMVDMEIRVNSSLSIDEAHTISEIVKGNIYNSIDHIQEVIIHVEPSSRDTKAQLKDNK